MSITTHKNPHLTVMLQHIATVYDTTDIKTKVKSMCQLVNGVIFNIHKTRFFNLKGNNRLYQHKTFP